MTIPKERWATKEKADEWIRADAKYDNEPSENYLRAFVQEEFSPHRGMKILEIGAGTGRLIGTISKAFPDIECHSVDVNPFLCDEVNRRHPNVITHVAAHDDLHIFEDSQFDLVFTFQCLQHCPNSDITTVANEIARISKDRILLMEGYQQHRTHGDQTHAVDGGSFYYDYRLLFPNLEKISVSMPFGQGVQCYLFIKEKNL